MVEEALVAAHPVSLGSLGRVAKEPQGRQHALPGLLAGDVAALDADRIGREPEADGRDARVGRRRIAIPDQPILGIAGIPEEAEGAFLELEEEGLDRRRNRRRRRQRLGFQIIVTKHDRREQQRGRRGQRQQHE